MDAKALARTTGDRKIEMVSLKEVQPLTGQTRGGVTAIGQNRGYPVFIDEIAEICDVISVSAGVRGTQILMAPADYVRAVEASVAAISKPKA